MPTTTLSVIQESLQWHTVFIAISISVHFSMCLFFRFNITKPYIMINGRKCSDFQQYNNSEKSILRCISVYNKQSCFISPHFSLLFSFYGFFLIFFLVCSITSFSFLQVNEQYTLTFPTVSIVCSKIFTINMNLNPIHCITRKEFDEWPIYFELILSRDKTLNGINEINLIFTMMIMMMAICEIQFTY